jgi:hypothetical protein
MNVNVFEQKLTEWIYLIDGGNLQDQNGTKINKGTKLKSHNYLGDHL